MPKRDPSGKFELWDKYHKLFGKFYIARIVVLVTACGAFFRLLPWLTGFFGGERFALHVFSFNLFEV